MNTFMKILWMNQKQIDTHTIVESQPKIRLVSLAEEIIEAMRAEGRVTEVSAEDTARIDEELAKGMEKIKEEASQKWISIRLA